MSSLTITRTQTRRTKQCPPGCPGNGIELGVEFAACEEERIVLLAFLPGVVLS